MIRFTLFGIPIEIQPWFWLTSAMLGGGFSANSSQEIKAVLVFMVISAISILIHELGHALVGRKLGGGSASILLYGMGGLAYSYGGRFTRSGHFWRIAAGPGAGLAFTLIIIATACLILGPLAGVQVTALLLFGIKSLGLNESAVEFLMGNPQRVMLLYNLLWINFWWSLVNLLPVMPLDGGAIANLFVKPQRRVYQIGIGVAVLAAIGGILIMQSYYVAILFGYLAFRNYQMMQESRWV